MTEHNFTNAFESVSQLVADFRQHEKAYLAPSYSEQDVRKNFIDKFWMALGWDVNHERQKNPNEREVKVESSVQVEGRRKKADYAFLASNFRDVRFFVEAKKPARDIDNPDDYFQTIRYGWNASAPLSILTDFEQFRVIDCRYKPDIQTAMHRAIPKLKLHYTDYADEEKFAEIYYLFSREAVIAGKLEAFAANLEKPTGKAAQRKLFGGAYKSVDEEFLQELDELRDELARSFKIRNSHLDGEALTEATQRTLDRLVFMRFLEDKLIEPEAMVERLGERGTAWADFVAESERLNKIYNGIIFKPHFIDKTDFIIDEHIFAGVRERLSHKNTPYDFNSLPVHILGSIYERFLGKVIVATDKRARVEEKPEVRKAGGVYYTPAYIVRYIVEQTIGELIKGKTPEEIALMRFADIACGSGSFLLGVYDELLRYHTAYYNEPKNRRKAIKAGGIETPDGSIRLSLNQRKDILLNNIYGVDLDSQAVEVAQLSLFLKLLEDETTASAKGFQLGFRETMLPSLDKNVVHGNSLIGWDIGGGLFEDEEERKLFPMDFEDAFPEVMRRGGFDAIVGNPPYGADLNMLARKHLAKKFPIGTTDSAALMMIRAREATKQVSRIGLIVPKPFTYSSTWDKTRDKLLAGLHILIDVGKAWKEVKLEQVVCIFDGQESCNYESLRRVGEEFVRVASISKSDVRHFGFYLNGLSNAEIAIGRKIIEGKPFLGELTRNSRGGMFQSLVQAEPPENEQAMRAIGGKQLQRCAINNQKGFVLWSQDVPLNAFVKPNSILIQNIVAHIANPTDHIKIIGTTVSEKEVAEIVILDTVNQLTNISNQPSVYLLTLLHSRLINWFVYRFIFAKAIRTMHFDAPVSDRIPIRSINFSETADRARHDRMLKLVEAMLEAKRQLQRPLLRDSERHFYESKCAARNRQIDTLVYELYDLTPEEIAIVNNRM
jgi:adenine-specific DNA-methyltransferase